MVNLAGGKRKKSGNESDDSAGSRPLPAGDDENNENCGEVPQKGDAPRRQQKTIHHPASSAAAYTDFSSVPEPCTIEEVLGVNAKSSSPPQRRRANELSIRRRGGGAHNEAESEGQDGGAHRRGPCPNATFPSKLHDILSRPDLADVVTWLPHGRSWRIVDQSAFVNRVMPHYFTQSKFASFMRQVNGWGFVRVTRGDEVNSYYCELFLRSKPSLARFMERKPAIRDMPGPEPNFAEYEDLPPNPNVDPASLVPLTPVPPPRPALKNKGEKRRRSARDEKGATSTPPSEARKDGKEKDVGEALSRAALSPPPALERSAAATAIMEKAAILQPTMSLKNMAEQPYPSQQFLQHQPPQNEPVQQTLLRSQLFQQQQAASFPAMPQAFPQEAPMQVPRGMATMMMPNVQQQLQGCPRMAQSSAANNNPNVMVSPSPQLSHAFLQAAGGSIVMPAQQQQQQQQNGTTNINNSAPWHPAQAMMAAKNSDIGGTGAQNQQGLQQQQVQFKTPQNPLELNAMLQPGQLSSLQQAVLEHQQAAVNQQQEALLQQQQATVNQQQPGLNVQGPQALNHGQVVGMNLGLQQPRPQPQQVIPAHGHLQQVGVQGADLPSPAPNIAKAPDGVAAAQQPAAPNPDGGASPAAAWGPPVVGLPQPTPLRPIPTLASAPAVPAAMPEAAAGDAAGGVFAGLDDRRPLGESLHSDDEDGGGATVGAGDDGGSRMEMDDVDVTGMIPVTVAGAGAGAFGGSLVEEGFMSGSLDDIW